MQKVTLQERNATFQEKSRHIRALKFKKNCIFFLKKIQFCELTINYVWPIYADVCFFHSFAKTEKLKKQMGSL